MKKITGLISNKLCQTKLKQEFCQVDCLDCAIILKYSFLTSREAINERFL